MKKNKHSILNTRRAFLKKAALASLGGSSLFTLTSSLSHVHAQVGQVNDYKSLVCIFLLGGNDAFNMVVPRSINEYNTYAATRLSLALNREELLTIIPTTSTAADYGLHPNMAGVQRLFANQKLAVIGNVGALIRPTTKADIVSGNAILPPQLFSHNDQQNFMMSLQADKPQQGWASRMADAMIGTNTSGGLPMNITLSGANTWQSGGRDAPYSLSANGIPTLVGINPNSTDELEIARTQVFQQLLAQPQNHLLIREFAKVQTRAMDLGAQVASALSGVAPLNTNFNQNSRLANNLKTVAQLISLREVLGQRRQMFFVGVGDYDTHGDQAGRHPLLMTELSESLASFYDATVELGIADKVTTFTSSDFGRTLTSNGDGTDHGWGSHQLVMGGAVNGGDIYGSMPELTIGSNDDFGEGRIIPTTSMDQYAATLARWYGLDSSTINETFFNLRHFNEQDLGFFI